MSMVLDTTQGKVPRVVYWGAELTAETPESVMAIVIVNREAWDGNAPDDLRETGIIPLEANAWKGRQGLVGHRDGGVSWSPRLKLADVQYSSGEVEEGVLDAAGEVAFLLYDERNGLRLRLTLEVLPFGVGRARASLTNTLETKFHLHELGIALPVPLEANEILDATGRWGKEKHAQRRPVSLTCDLRENRRGRTGSDAPGMTFVGPRGFSFRHGEIWGFHTAFSGNHRTWVEKLPSGEQVIGGSEVLLPGEISLAEGETYDSPAFYFQHAHGLDEAANALHQWMRSRPHHVSLHRPVTFNVWEAVYFEQDPTTIMSLADKAASVGVERFVLDDGWFRGRRDDWAGLGDWYVDTDLWPEGLEPLAAHVRSLGMEFGLWFEPEMINQDSDLARAHPEWIMGAQGGTSPEELPLLARHQQVLNIALPEASKYLEDRIVGLVQELGIGYIKWDHNRDLTEAGDLTIGGRAAVSRQTRAFYALVDAIKARCPGLEIESCSSGGARVDLEVMQHMDRVWVSDCIDPVERQAMMRWTGQLLPPELLGSHIASPWSHSTGRWSTIAMRGATAIWGHLGIEWDISTASEEELADLRLWVEFYKQNRQFLHSGETIRCETPDDSIWLHGVVDASRSRALFEMVTRHRSVVAPRGRLRFAGLDPAKVYRIRPVLVGSPPSGLVAPPWFGLAAGYVATNERRFEPSQQIPGIVMTGAALQESGVHTPRLHPDQSLVIEIAEEGR
ncbi:MAG: alpha-galactosidase [Propionibacteriaceae bacterium]|nr:alpha-galactosidase [Propionibacteriaceae bacterium]